MQLVGALPASRSWTWVGIEICLKLDGEAALVAAPTLAITVPLALGKRLICNPPLSNVLTYKPNIQYLIFEQFLGELVSYTM